MVPLCWSLLFLICIHIVTEGCIESERIALLEFKNGLTNPSNRLANWVPNSSNCCTWSGVVCHNLTFHVLELHLQTLSPQEFFGSTELTFISGNEYRKYDEYMMTTTLSGNLSSSLLHLKHLTYLDLSFNYFPGVSIPEFIGSMQSLRYLNLSYAAFHGAIPPKLGNLSNLNYLDLGFNSLRVENLDWVASLSSLKFLDLSMVDLSRSFDWLESMNSLPLLAELYLYGCSLSGFSPSTLSNFNFSSLAVLDLSQNGFGGPIPNALQNMSSFLLELDLSSNYFNSSIPNWLYDLTHLQLLHLGGNQLCGQISSGIGNLTSLTNLDFSYNNGLEFENGIPNSFQNLCNLRSLSLSRVKFRQEIRDVFGLMSRCISSALKSLALRNCQLSGHLTNNFANFESLVMFDISYNSISGPIPPSFGNLSKLKHVDISHNKLRGEVSQPHFANLGGLVNFLASEMGENIVLGVGSNWIPPLRLQILQLGSWNIGYQFPNWLRLLNHLVYLDLSNSKISTPIPLWFWDLLPNYDYFNISHNQMHGSIPNIPFINGNIPLIDLSYNNFSGVLPCFSSNVTVLDLSHNLFSGSISNLLCYKMNDEKQMRILNLEGNLLHGEIPDCWRSWRNLDVIKLSNNYFSGDIPNSIGTLKNLQVLHLRNNNLSGEVPPSIQNCKMLFLLDIRENNLDGNISTWIGDSFSQLSILSLHANKFDGKLPKQLCHLVSLHILDLSHNNFSGAIPSCFSNFTGMTIRNDTSGSFFPYGSQRLFIESALLLIKGTLMEYSTNLRYVRSIDISNNNIYGEIPLEITSIVGLQSLNLSQNALTGRIPNNIGDMKGLEAIDFSRNKLSGEIPESMSTLTFLSTLDLSYNNFSGRIPLGTQLQSFNSSSYMGNNLCGLPLTDNCASNQLDPHVEEDDDSGDEIDVWFYESMAFGFVFGFWSVIVTVFLQWLGSRVELVLTFFQ